MSGLYLHIPFCEQKCVYCDFYSIEDRSPVDDFLRALHTEIDLRAPDGAGETFGTIYFGGGTPSLLPPNELRRILEHLHRVFKIRPDAEVTLEANPGTTDRASLRGFHDAGVNRLSLGIQSFHDDELAFLSRIHSAADANEAIRAARAAGFRNLSIDLIFALPRQSMESWKDNLQKALATGAEHISAYSLIVEPGTPLQRMVKAGTVTPSPTEKEAEMYELTMSFLASAGFEHYEVSNYARPGFHSIHNSSYWNHTPYIGFGPSAHSFRNGRRWWNVASLQPYCRRLVGGELPVSGSEELTRIQLRDEAIMLGLRSGGIDCATLKDIHGVDLIASLNGEIHQLIHDRLAVLESSLLRLTDRGFLLCDAIGERFVSRLPS